jgi:ABC-type polysaccharide/polyol phosphate transport system ATPase subunit
MPDTETVIKVHGLHKSFRLPHEQHSGIKQLLINKVKGKKGYETQHVLDDVTFEINRGDFFGIVGRNGSGKSTLLKLLAGIYIPDEGSVKINGSITPFIELGVGFNPELTGRENVFLNGALLGFNRREIESMYDDIVGFAELEKFMDQKLKNYSSGMQVRLAFSIAIKAKGEILILDEVLAVGDQAFQQKCFSYFSDLKKDKKTVVLVTHDMGAVKQFCNKALILEGGSVKTIGKPDKVSLEYEMLNFETAKTKDGSSQTEEPVVIIKALDSDGKTTNQFKYGQEIVLMASWAKDLKVGIAGFIISKNGESVFSTNTINDAVDLSRSVVRLKLKPNIGDGRYKVTIGLFGKNRYDVLRFKEGPEIIIHGQPRYGEDGDEWQGIIYIENEWQ